MNLAESVKTILVVDDHPVVRAGLAELISHRPDLQVCGEAGDVASALQQVRDKRPDLVIVDLTLESGDGLELIKQIHAIDDKIRVLVLSKHDEELYAERVVRVGAMGYVNKKQSQDCLLDAIGTVLGGKVYLSPAMTERVLQRSLGQGDRIEGSPLDGLSDRELQVFQLIGEGLTVRAIARQLGLSPKTIETYRENIKAKLQIENATELARHAVRWVLEEG